MLPAMRDITAFLFYLLFILIYILENFEDLHQVLNKRKSKKYVHILGIHVSQIIQISITEKSVL